MSGAVPVTWRSLISPTGEFVRKESTFRDRISKDGKFPPAAGRYHLYVANACPWAHRTRVVRSLKGLEDVISISFVGPFLGENGWAFDEQHKDSVHGFKQLREVYSLAAGKDWTDRVTVPVLFDKETNLIVNNESSEIIEMFNSEFNEFAATPEQAALDLYPAAKRAEIDELNQYVYNKLNNGVYKAGFARSQSAYNEAVFGVFEALDVLEMRLAKTRFLFPGANLTLADVRLFTTLIRFDPVYFVHFKCCRRALTSYTSLWAFARDIYNLPGIRSTIDMEDARYHYFSSHETVNPFRIVPIPTLITYEVPQERKLLP